MARANVGPRADDATPVAGAAIDAFVLLGLLAALALVLGPIGFFLALGLGRRVADLEREARASETCVATLEARLATLEGSERGASPATAPPPPVQATASIASPPIDELSLIPPPPYAETARYASAFFVIATTLKVFLFDLAGLEDVLRALSFMGLGAALIGIGLVYQKLAFARPAAAPPAKEEIDGRP